MFYFGYFHSKKKRPILLFMKRKDPRLLNECKDKVIPLFVALSNETHIENPIFDEFIKATDYYENLTQEFNQMITNVESLNRQIDGHEKTLRDLKERTRAAIILYFGKNSDLYHSFMRSSEYNQQLKSKKAKEKKLKSP